MLFVTPIAKGLALLNATRKGPPRTTTEARHTVASLLTTPGHTHTREDVGLVVSPSAGAERVGAPPPDGSSGPVVTSQPGE